MVSWRCWLLTETAIWPTWVVRWLNWVFNLCWLKVKHISICDKHWVMRWFVDLSVRLWQVQNIHDDLPPSSVTYTYTSNHSHYSLITSLLHKSNLILIQSVCDSVCCCNKHVPNSNSTGVNQTFPNDWLLCVSKLLALWSLVTPSLDLAKTFFSEMLILQNKWQRNSWYKYNMTGLFTIAIYLYWTKVNTHPTRKISDEPLSI